MERKRTEENLLELAEDKWEIINGILKQEEKLQDQVNITQIKPN
jgi:hypothetical protein